MYPFPFDSIDKRLNNLESLILGIESRLLTNQEAKNSQNRILKTREETKEIFNITDPTLNKRVKDGKLKKVCLGRRVLYDLTEFLSPEVK